VTIFILCGEALIFALHGWLTAVSGIRKGVAAATPIFNYNFLHMAVKKDIKLIIRIIARITISIIRGTVTIWG
jgi:hypothetical protein